MKRDMVSVGIERSKRRKITEIMMDLKRRASWVTDNIIMICMDKFRVTKNGYVVTYQIQTIVMVYRATGWPHFIID